MKFSIIIPIRNEEDYIESTIKDILVVLLDKSINFEIIVINDKCTDRSEIIIKQLLKNHPEIRYIAQRPPYGFGFAIQKGLGAFKGDYAITMMADGSDDPEDLLSYIQEVQKENVDACFGNRWDPSIKIEGYPFFKYVLNRTLNYFIHWVFKVDYKDTTNAFKCYSRRVIETISPIHSEQFNITVELPLKTIISGFNYSVVPTKWYARKNSKPRLILKEMGSRYFTVLYQIFKTKKLMEQEGIKNILN